MREVTESEDIFLRLDLQRSGTVKGESTDGQHLNEIELTGWAWGLHAASVMAAVGPATKATAKELRLVKRVDRSSPVIMSAVRPNDMVKRAVITMRKSGGEQQAYFALTIEKGRITSYDVATATGRGEEQITLSFRKIQVEYRPQRADGHLAGAVVFAAEMESGAVVPPMMTGPNESGRAPRPALTTVSSLPRAGRPRTSRCKPPRDRRPMPELTPQERLQPALLDRLIDDDSGDPSPEPPERRVLNKSRLRAAVLRDLAWLFNAVGLGSREDLGAVPNVARSVLNFGLPPLSGQTVSTLDIVELEQWVRTTIERFEPRILPDTLEVEAVMAESQLDLHNVVSIQIRGALWAQPVPLELLLRTDVDFETGEVRIRDLARGG